MRPRQWPSPEFDCSASLFFSCKCIAVTPVKALFISQMKKKEIDISSNGFDRNIPATPKTIDPRITIPPAIIFGAGEWYEYTNKTPNKTLRIHKSLSQIDRNIIPRAQQELKIIAPPVISIISFCTTFALRGRAECGALCEVLLEGRLSSLIVCTVHMRQCFSEIQVHLIPFIF